MKPVNPKPEKYISIPPELNEKLIHLRLVVMYKFQSIKTYSKGYKPNWISD